MNTINNEVDAIIAIEQRCTRLFFLFCLLFSFLRKHTYYSTVSVISKHQYLQTYVYNERSHSTTQPGLTGTFNEQPHITHGIYGEKFDFLGI